MCFLKDVAATVAGPTMTVSWGLEGAWARDPEARLEVVLQQEDPASRKFRDAAVLRESVLPAAGKVEVDAAAYSGRSFRVKIRKVGDSETGALSSVFDLK